MDIELAASAAIGLWPKSCGAPAKRRFALYSRPGTGICCAQHPLRCLPICTLTGSKSQQILKPLVAGRLLECQAARAEFA